MFNELYSKRKIIYKYLLLELREEAGTEYYADTQTGMELIVIKHILAISIVVLEKEVKIRFIAHSPYKVDDGVEIQIPSGSFDKGKTQG